MRTMLFSISVLVGCVAIAAAADPIPLTEEKRVELVGKWRDSYDKAKKKAEEREEKGRVLQSNPKTAGDGKAMVNEAKEQLAALKKNLYSSWSIRLTDTAKEGYFGTLIQPAVVVAEHTDSGTVIDMAFQVTPFGSGGPESRAARFVVYPPLKAAPKAKVTLPGLYACIGKTTVNGKDVLVIQRIEVRPEEMPK